MRELPATSPRAIAGRHMALHLSVLHVCHAQPNCSHACRHFIPTSKRICMQPGAVACYARTACQSKQLSFIVCPQTCVSWCPPHVNNCACLHFAVLHMCSRSLSKRHCGPSRRKWPDVIRRSLVVCFRNLTGTGSFVQLPARSVRRRQSHRTFPYRAGHFEKGN